MSTYDNVKKCIDCDGELKIPKDATVGEIISCPDCGLNYQVKKTKDNNYELEEEKFEGEDWGE